VAAVLTAVLRAACAGAAARAPAGAPGDGAAGAAPPRDAGAAPERAQAAASDAGAAGPRTRVKAGYTVVSSAVGPLWLAADRGLWEPYGLDVELTLISGTPIIMAALIAGEVQFAQSAGDSALSVQARNPDVVTFLNASGPSLHRMMVQPTIQRMEDLRGKRFGVFTIGDGNYSLISKALLKFGMSPETDAVWTSVGGGNFGGLVQALAAGSIDATLLTPPNDLIAARNGARDLFRLRDLDLPSAGLPVFTLRRTLDDQRPVVEAFARGIVDGIRLFRGDPAAAKQSMSQHMDLSDPPLLDWTYDAVVADGLISRPFVDVAQLRAVIEALLPEQPDLAQLALDRVIDSTVMETLDRQGYLPPP
jgi:NitT/TauT family transport system substrate-binding protein